MDSMTPVIVALLTLLGSAGAVEWFRRRDQRESIKSDLEVWEKLPPGQAKDRLIARIEQRVADVGYPPRLSFILRSAWGIPALYAIVGIAVADLLHFLGGSYVLRRHSTDGLLWVDTPHGSHNTLEGTIFYDLLMAVGMSFGLLVALPWLLDRAFSRRQRDPAEESKSQPQPPNTALEPEAQG